MDSATERRLIDELSALLQAGSTTIAPGVFTMPSGTYVAKARQERERAILFTAYPLAVTLTCRIADAGDFVTEDVAGLPLLIVRGVDGLARCFVNVCRHRGNRVCLEPRGNRRRFACQYHGWTYDQTGSCRSFGDRGAFEGLDPAEWGLRELPTEERHGLIWVVPTPGASIDVRGFLGDVLDQELADQHLESQFLFVEETLRRDFNWKLGMDTFQEVFHVNVLHKETLKGIFTGVATYEEFGPHHRFTAIRSSFPELWNLPADEQNLLPHVSIVYLIFPNTCVIWQMDHIELWHFYPAADSDDVASIRNCLLVSSAPDEKATRYWTKNWELAKQSIWTEDFDTMARIQQNLKVGAVDRIVFGRNEAALQHYHRSIALAVDTEERP